MSYLILVEPGPGEDLSQKDWFCRTTATTGHRPASAVIVSHVSSGNAPVFQIKWFLNMYMCSDLYIIMNSFFLPSIAFILKTICIKR